MISVIVPVYNAEKYIEECVKSICEQTYTDTEIILVDDGSEDTSLEKCKRLSQSDYRIRIISKTNGGVSSARNRGLEEAKGDLIAFSDADDILKPNLLERLLFYMEKYNADRVCGGYEHFYNDGHVVYRKPRVPDGMYKRDELLKIMIDDGSLSGFLFSGVNNSLFRKRIIEENQLKFNENIKYNEDSLFSFEYALKSNGVYSLRSEPLYRYRQHGESATGTRKSGDKYTSLHQYLEKTEFDKVACEFDIQMKRRAVTIALWEILDIAKIEKGNTAINHINEQTAKTEVVNGLDYIKAEKLNKQKKLYYKLIQYKSNRILYLLTKYILPFAMKRMSR